MAESALKEGQPLKKYISYVQYSRKRTDTIQASAIL